MPKKENYSIKANDTRRNFIKKSVIGIGSIAIGSSPLSMKGGNIDTNVKRKGDQRLSLRKLKDWESLGYGMFIHFGMSTYLGKEKPDGSADPSLYAPDNLDVDQWISVAKEAGMKYAVLTTKHVAGHCLWPSKYTDYTVANSTNRTDVVLQLVNACKKYGIKHGIYY